MRKVEEGVWVTSTDNGKYMVVTVSGAYQVWVTDDTENGVFSHQIDSAQTLAAAKRKISALQKNDKKELTGSQKVNALSDYFGYSKSEAREMLEDMGE